jgi:hypothetical protein
LRRVTWFQTAGNPRRTRPDLQTRKPLAHNAAGATSSVGARLRRLLRVGIVLELGQRLLQQQGRMVGEIAASCRVRAPTRARLFFAEHRSIRSMVKLRVTLPARADDQGSHRDTPSAGSRPAAQFFARSRIGHDAPLPGALWQVPASRSRAASGRFGVRFLLSYSKHRSVDDIASRTRVRV